MHRIVKNSDDLIRLYSDLGNMQHPFTASIVLGAKRTDQQNDTIHMWFGEIAAQRGDSLPGEVKAECNLQFGRPILSRDDPEWNRAFGYLFDNLSHEAKLKAIRVLDVPFTRKMRVKQLTEYMSEMAAHFRPMGFRLTDPEARKYEAEQ